MTTPVQQKIRDKKRTPQQIVDMIKPGDWVNIGSVGGDSTVLAYEVAQRLGPNPGDLNNIEFWNYAMFYPHPEFQEVDPNQEYHCFHEYFFFPWSRRARDRYNVTSWAQWGWTIGMWWHHYRFANRMKDKRGIDWWFNAATAPDGLGFFNWSYGVNNCNIFRQTARNLVVEVRDDYPWAEGGRFNTINIDDVEYWVEVDTERWQWPQVNEKGIQPAPEEKKIAEYVLSIMQDRDVVQLGIGSLPSACVTAMADAGLKDLGVHTEMLNFGLLNLIESGQVTNRYKNLAAYDIDYTNNFHVLTRIDNMIAIDNCLAVDLLGQQSTGFYDKRPISSSGGYFQFVSFCAQSKGGRGVASMRSRSKHGTSRIVPFLPEGSSVDVPAQLSNYVCTEYGIVNLRGLNGYERAASLISIAHPDEREWLEKEAYENNLLPPKFPVNFEVKEGETRKYPSYEDRRDYKTPSNSMLWGYDWDDDMQSGK
jgi:acyl-CoA hydrolase